MKLLILLALASFTVAQFPLDVDPMATQGVVGMPRGGIVGGYDTDVDMMVNGPYNRLGGVVGGQRGIYGTNPYAVPQTFGLPSYGPFVRYGNRVVPVNMLPYTAYGGMLNRYHPVGPFTPIGGLVNPIQDPLLDTMSRYPSVGPYSPISGLMNPIQDPLLNNIPQYGDEISQLTPYGSPISSYGSPIMTPYGSPIMTPYGSPIMSPYGSPIMSQYGSPITPYGNDLNSYPQQYNSIDNVNGFTPYSQAALFNLITRGGISKLDLYGKLILGRSTGLTRKMREVCPEIDGGLSYVSCLTDAHSKTFKCLKGVENHPRYLTCTHKPIIKKVMRDWYVNDFNFHKEIVKCLSTTTYVDKITEKMTGVPLVPIEDDLSSSESTEELTGKVGYNVEFGINTRQCFYKLRRETSKCSELASQCPKFKKCYIHPTIKTLEVRKHVKQAKFVKLLDSCLAGAAIPEEIVPEDFTPDSIYPAEMLF